LYESDESLLAGALHDLDVDALKRDGFVRLSLPDAVLPYENGNFSTPSGRTLLASSTFGSIGLPSLPTFIPGRETLAGDADLVSRYPLAMMSSKIHQRFLNASYSHLDHHAAAEGSIYCELDPADASARGIRDGDAVLVFNDRASLHATARVSDAGSRVRPGLVIVPFGWVGERTEDGNTVNMLTSDTATDWGGGVAFYDTLVEVARA
jgi:anaerobic selenocysteine-containing dehydrogenase